MKTITECLNFIDGVIASDECKRINVENLENVRHYVSNKTKENKIIMLDILSCMNKIIEKFYVDDKNDIVNDYERLRLFILIWLDALDGVM